MTLTVPEINSPLQAEHTFKSDLATASNDHETKITDLLARVDELEAAQDKAEEDPLFTTKIYGPSEIIRPFEEGGISYCEVLMVATLEYSGTEGTRGHNFIGRTTDGTISLTIGGSGVSGMSGSGTIDLCASFTVVEDALFDGEIEFVEAGAGSGTSTISMKQWIVKRYT